MDEVLDMPPSQALSVSGTEFPLVSAGDGEAILFVHGAWADHRAWHAAWREVADRHRFLAYTQRHFGPWNWPADKPYSRDVHASDLVGVVAALDTPVCLVGWSYAGAMLIAAAGDLPHLVRGLVLYEPSLPELLPDTLEGRNAAEDFWRGLEPAYETARRRDVDEGIRRGLEFTFGLADGGFAELNQSTQHVFLANAHTMFSDLEAPAPTAVIPAQLSEISRPALVLVGETTHAQYRLEAARLANAVPAATLATISGVGHGGPVQDPTTLTKTVLEFVAELTY